VRRLFVALPIPEEVVEALGTLRGGVPDARWIPDESMHVTLCFCGEVDGATMRDLIGYLGNVSTRRPTLEIAGVDLFADGKRPRALVANVVRTQPLEELQARVTQVARGAGIEIDRRRFRPHVTLARFSSRAETGHHLAQFMAGNSLFRAGPWMAESFILYSSRMSSEGAVYIAEVEYPLF